MDKFEIAKRLMHCFPNSFINQNGEFIAHRYSNQYFILDNCAEELDVKCKILAWFSRAAHKTEPYKTSAKNREFHEFMLNGINEFLGTSFTETSMDAIYTYLGNDINRSLCEQFVNSGYDMCVLEEYENGKKLSQFI